MIRFNRVLPATLAILCLSSATPVNSVFQINCSNIKVEEQVTDGRGNSHIIKLKASGAQKPVHYVFFKKSGELLSRDFKSGKYETSEKGRIYYAVKDAEGCTVKSSVLIE